MRSLIGRWISIFALILAGSFSSISVGYAQQPASGTHVSGGSPASIASPAPAEAPKFGIVALGDNANPWFEVTIESGASVHLTAGVRNYGTVPVTLNAYATNALNPPNGGFSAGNQDDKPTGATRWVDFANQSFTLAPKQVREINFTAAVPSGTPPGFYVVALVAETSESLEIPGTKSLRQYIRSATSVEVTVPGKMTSGFTLGTPTMARAGTVVRLDVPIKNTGTARLRPEGILSVTASDGKEVATAPITMGSFYGGYSTSVRAVLPGQLPDGTYLISLQLKDAESGTSASITSVKTTLAAPKKPEGPPQFVVDQASVTPNGKPVQYADVAATVTNNGQLIPTANVMLDVKRDGQEVEQYALAQNQALPTGQTKISQRYIPKDGWKPGTWTFQIVVSAVSIGTGTQTVLATVDVPGAITIP